MAYGNVRRGVTTDEPMNGKDMVVNNSGAYVFELDDWQRLERFLILGSEGGTYYTKERELTKDNMALVSRLLKADGRRVVSKIANISLSGRAPKNDTAVFALALAATDGDADTRRAAFLALPAICRTGTMLFHFLQYRENLGGGWGRGMANAVGNWYNRVNTVALARQLIKYRQRDGWTHADALRLSHPKPMTPIHNTLFKWAVDGWPDIGELEPDADAVKLIWAHEKAQRVTKPVEATRLIRDYQLTWEAFPTEVLKSKLVWAALLPHMGLTALVRNLGRMTANGTFDNGAALLMALQALGDAEELSKQRLHPFNILLAMKQYGSGGGMRGSLTWEPKQAIMDALDKAFYDSFESLPKIPGHICVAVDVSGSMGAPVSNMPLTARDAAAAMAMVIERSANSSEAVVFHNKLAPAPWGQRQRLDDVVKVMNRQPFGGTDISLPFEDAWKNDKDFDAFVVLTDSETNSNKIHPALALAHYRNKVQHPVKLVVAAFTSTGFTIADPNDSGMLDIVGMDSAVPSLLADFLGASYGDNLGIRVAEDDQV